MYAMFYAIISGVLIFVIGQIVLKIFIEPVQELMRTLGQIRYCMTFYANIFCNPGVVDPNKMDQTIDELRLSASKLHGAVYLVRFLKLWELLKFIPSKENLEQVSSELIGLSNSVYDGKCDENVKRRDKILSLISVNDESQRSC